MSFKFIHLPNYAHGSSYQPLPLETLQVPTLQSVLYILANRILFVFCLKLFGGSPLFKVLKIPNKDRPYLLVEFAPYLSLTFISPKLPSHRTFTCFSSSYHKAFAYAILPALPKGLLTTLPYLIRTHPHFSNLNSSNTSLVKPSHIPLIILGFATKLGHVYLEKL